MLVIYIRMLILIFDLDQTVGDLPNLCLKYLNMRFQGSRGFISAPGCGRGTRRRRRGAEPSPWSAAGDPSRAWTGRGWRCGTASWPSRTSAASRGTAQCRTEGRPEKGHLKLEVGRFRFLRNRDSDLVYDRKAFGRNVMVKYSSFWWLTAFTV